MKKTPRAPPKLPKNGIGTLGRKSEHSTSLFCAAKGSFRVPFVQYRFWSLPRSLMDFFEASPYGVLANGGGGVKTHGTRRLRDVRERARRTKRLRTAPRLGKAPPPGGAGGGRGALLAVRRRRNNSRPFSFCQAFSFGPTWAKEKAEVGEVKREMAIVFGRILPLGSLM